ncbi:MAG: argininosuccinate synthase [Pseudomonadota bacterium]
MSSKSRFASRPVKKVVLAYSGGLDTSVLLVWLRETYGCEIVTFTADLGQGEDLQAVHDKAVRAGVAKDHIFIEDLRESFVTDYVFPMFRANAVYEGCYLMGTAIARPITALRQIEIARQVGADALCHGCTGKGNDQYRFELAYAALAPELRGLAPWREWDLNSRESLLAYAQAHQVAIDANQDDKPPYSMDANVLHTSYEGGILEDPWAAAPDEIFTRSVNPADAPNTPQDLVLTFAAGDAVALDGKNMSPAQVLAALNDIAGRHGVGRLDIVENRRSGMKSRGVYETPGGTVLLAAHRAIESITLDIQAAHLKDEIMPRYAQIIYDGLWFSPEREALQALIDSTQQQVNGEVRLRLYKGQVTVTGRRSPDSLYQEAYATFGADDVFDQQDSSGSIRIAGLRLRLAAERKAKR